MPRTDLPRKDLPTSYPELLDLLPECGGTAADRRLTRRLIAAHGISLAALDEQTPRGPA